MRNLTMKQKRMIAKAGRVTPTLLLELEKVNDYETMWQDANRFCDDLRIKRMEQTIHRAMNYNQARLYDEDKYIKDWR